MFRKTTPLVDFFANGVPAKKFWGRRTFSQICDICLNHEFLVLDVYEKKLPTILGSR